MEITYSNLNTKSHYSCGIGIGTSAEIINKAKEKGLFGIALTDKNTIAGLLDFYNTGKKLKFPVALGVEISYFNSQNKISSVLLLAKDFDGYINLCKLITASWDNEDLYNEPCVSLYDLNEYGSNLYCFINNRDQFADLKSIFNNSLFVQLILNKDNIENNKILININHQKIITCDAYIPDFNYKVLQDIMLSNSKIEDKEKINFIKPILSPIELMQEWKLNHSDYIKLEDLAYSFKTSNAIIEECSKISLKFKDQVVNFPHLLHPLNNDGCSKEELTWRIAKQYGRLKIDIKEYFDRFQYEMDSICNNSRVNLIDYFLVLEDLCRWCRENGITVGPGRGSGAGALVNYCLKITHLDPIENNLLFERFISKGRIENGTLPDVDLDFSDQDRVRTYLTEKYGTDRVLRIGTFQTLKVLGSIKDIAKSLQHKYPELDFVTVNNVTKTLGKKDLDESEIEFYERNLEENKTLQDFFSKYPEIKESTTRLVGYNRQAGQHPCGLALCQDSIINFAPIRKYKGQKILELNAPACEQSGIIKYDILGLRTLLYIQTTCDLVGIKDIYELPLDDKKTFQAFVDGDTNGVFQFNSDVAIGILNKLPVNAMSLEILSMVTSVGRPGPMGNGQHIEFYKRVRREKLATAPHPALEEELKPTYGIMIYQENVMKASQILGGFTLAEADDLRKAMGKKKPELLISYKDKFVKYCWQHYPDTKNEYRDELNIPQGITVAEHIFELMATFSGYGFCKAHAVAYALIGYYCQFLKTHYPLQWWTACLTHTKDDKLQKYYKDAEQYCLDPEINNSTNKYEIINNKIQMPISAIKGLGPKATEQIFNLRPFNSFQDFMDRINKRSINKAVVLKLIYAGCFDALHPNSHQALINYYFSEIRKEQVPNEIKEITKSQLLDLRMKSLAYLQRDLYLIYKEHFSEEPTEYENCKMSIKPLYLFGSVVSLKKRKTKNNNDMGTLTISNNGEELKITVWSDELNFFQYNLKEKNEVRVKVKTSEYNGNTQLTLINCELLGDK